MITAILSSHSKLFLKVAGLWFLDVSWEISVGSGRGGWAVLIKLKAIVSPAVFR